MPWGTMKCNEPMRVAVRMMTRMASRRSPCTGWKMMATMVEERVVRRGSSKGRRRRARTPIASGRNGLRYVRRAAHLSAKASSLPRSSARPGPSVMRRRVSGERQSSVSLYTSASGGRKLPYGRRKPRRLLGALSSRSISCAGSGSYAGH